jgi:Resolvase, N terminal domain
VHSTGVIYGYARVSTDGQSVAAQVSQLKAAGCEKVFREVASGARTDRNQLRQALEHLAAGDVLMVTPAGSVGPFNPRSSQHPGVDRQQKSRISVPE